MVMVLRNGWVARSFNSFADSSEIDVTGTTCLAKLFFQFLCGFEFTGFSKDGKAWPLNAFNSFADSRDDLYIMFVALFKLSIEYFRRSSILRVLSRNYG